MTLRELRAWHWKRNQWHRQRETKYRSSKLDCRYNTADHKHFARLERRHERAANFHISAVQLLNDVCFPDQAYFCTAEHDVAGGM